MPEMQATQRAAHQRAPARAAHAAYAAPAVSTLSAPPGVIRRASACACGGGCPRCKAGSHGSEASEDDAAKRLASMGAHAKLKVGAPDDPLEREADALADRVTGRAVPDHPSWHSQPAEAGGSGKQLAPGLRSFFEQGFGRGFDRVRIHTGPAAAASSNALNARAYTLGSDIWFNQGEFDPGSQRGRHLLAHELAHVTQSGAAATVRRAPLDFQVDDLPTDAPFDTGQIYFERSGVNIPATEQAKIAALAKPAKRPLTLHGQSSEDTPAATQPIEIEARLDAVEDALKKAGHTGTRTRAPHPGEGTGDIDYRSRRGVRVVPTPKGMKAAPNPKNPCGVAGSEVAKNKELTTCEKQFDDAFDKASPGAKEIADKAEKDIVTTPTAAATAVVNQFFAGVPRPEIDANVTAIAKQVRQLRARHQCHTTCDGGCNRPAYNSGTGLGATGAMVTICPDFVSAQRDFRVDTLIHEASHGNPLLSVDDVAYSNTRLIPFLLPADAKRNTDSYVLLMRLVHKAGSKQFGPVTPDVLTGMNAVGAGSDTEQTQRAVAWLESWLNYGAFDTGILYQTIVESLSTPVKKWVTSGTNEFNVETMNRIATAFPGEFTDPGADGTARNTPPTDADKIRVAALHDRFGQMYSVINQQVINVTRVAAGTKEEWGRQKALPRMTQDVKVNPDFFTKNKVDQVKRLVELMVHTRTDISLSFEPKYVKLIDLIRVHRKLGP